MIECRLLVVGAGAAGIASSVSAWKNGCHSILLVDRGMQSGGILPQCLHEGFGLAKYGKELTGPEYASQLTESLRETGVIFFPGTEVLSISHEKYAIISRRGLLDKISFEKLILAAGCREKTIGSLPVAGTRPAGIFTAGQAQECMNLHHQNLGEEILILGSGDLGMIMARRFTLERKHVIAVLEQDLSYGGMARNFHRCIEPYRIPIWYRTTITEIHGTGRITGVTVKNLDTGETKQIPCDTLVTAVGLIPERELVRTLDKPDWLYLVGNCRHIHELVDSAVAEAEQIAREAVAL